MTDDEEKEIKSVILKFRVTPSFKQQIKELKDATPGYKNMELQQFVVRLIELGIEEENKLINLKKNEAPWDYVKREEGVG